LTNLSDLKAKDKTEGKKMKPKVFMAMEPDNDGGFVIHVASMAEAKLEAYKTAAWALAHGYAPYVMSFTPNSVKLTCPGLADMTFKIGSAP
jgi:hypothetical protein